MKAVADQGHSLPDPSLTPSVTALATELCADAWDLCCHLVPLGAEKDLIYRARNDDGRNYVLRLSHPNVTPESITLQLDAMVHAARQAPSLGLPLPVANADGALFFRADMGEGFRPLANLTTWVEGTLLVDALAGPEQAYNVGAYVGRLSGALANFDHADADYYMPWDIANTADMVNHLGSITDPDERSLVSAAIDRFVSETAPRLEKVRHQIIHADATPFNVLVKSDAQDHVAGIIDFGDVVRTALVCDVAVTACYLMGQGDGAMHLPAQVVRGFHGERPLQDDELALIVPLMEARHAMTVAITREHAARRPENAKAITKNTATASRGLATLAARSHDDWTGRLLAAVNQEGESQ